MASDERADQFVKVASVDEIREQTPIVVQADGRSLGLFYHEDRVFATDNRCPHMGFPLTDGSVEDGILTCPWHHARFEISCGDTLDPFADDVQTYPVNVLDGDVYVNPTPEREKDPAAHWRDRLEHGLEENLSLVIAKSVIGLEDADAPHTVPVELGTEFGTHYREDGWGRGLTTLALMTNLLDALRPEDRQRALYIGLTEVASDCAGEPPFFVQDPLSVQDISPERLQRWFRENIEVRDSDGAERVLRAAIRTDLDESQIAGMFAGAATDHLYLDNGHRLDLINKAFETLDHIGWNQADVVLPSLVPSLAEASRAEEDASWRQPIDIAELLFEAYESLPQIVTAGEAETWEEPDGFVEILLGDDPQAIIDSLSDAIREGARPTELATLVAYAAARRVAQFGTSNEFRDWNTVHHTYTYANAVYGMADRTDTWEVYRGVYDGAMNVYLDRFLNTPPTPLPSADESSGVEESLDELMETFEIEADEEVNRAGRSTAAYLAAGGSTERLKQKLGEALLREDVGFHPRQNIEAAFNQYACQADQERAEIHLIATTRFLAAHTPTRRAGEQTFRIAQRLHRGEKIHEA